MKQLVAAFAAGSIILVMGMSTSLAQDDDQMEPATPVEIFACNYNEGKSYADLDPVVDKFNEWADKQGIDYAAWTLVPYYAGPKQDFDYLWLGGSKSAQALGRAQDLWLSKGGKILDMFDDVAPCQGHANFAALKFKTPAKRDNPSNIIISFSDCNMADGLTFDDVAPALSEWAEYRDGHGSTAGMWVFFPAYGAGGEEFDFKFIASWGNLEEQGADWDQYSASGHEKAAELFAGKLECDASRVYLTKNRRMAPSDDE